jgi:nucleoside-diphosphate-sugar epimerase
MKDKDKVLILGVAGFTGKHFLTYIYNKKLTENFEFLGVDNYKCEVIDFPTLEMDLSVSSNVRTLLLTEKPDYIINLIGTFASNDFSQLFKINVDISQNIMAFCSIENIPIKNILLLGSAAEYGSCNNLPIAEDNKVSPVSMYGLSKVFQTESALYYSRNHNVNITVARPFNILGKGLSNALSIGSFVHQIKKAENNGSIYVGDINTKRDFIDISDAIDAYWKLLLFGNPGEIYNVCAGYSFSIKEILNIIIKLSGKKIEIVVNSEFFKKNDIQDSYGDNSKLKKLTNWHIKETIENALLKMF